MSELLPCPFCGERGYSGSLGPAKTICKNIKCVIWSYHIDTAAWNTRPPQPDLSKVREVLTDLRRFMHSDLNSPMSLIDHVTIGDYKRAHEAISEMTELIDSFLSELAAHGETKP